MHVAMNRLSVPLSPHPQRRALTFDAKIETQLIRAMGDVEQTDPFENVLK